ncbi:glycosyl hydrolase family 28 protein [Xanthocytophaga flava]|uniref:glycosyl hydrolase family 28 protein n=1 Tax=Xanthocytophaga flava TaxID=3048013 RepID=UPI0028D871EF|nr:glycosyl hydrolase family 28 protein [Xanthocytophaga flavus]MDJ1468704.1 glycosyl hydrolase family 28 protein [Xanthocytophaga flavus]
MKKYLIYTSALLLLTAFSFLDSKPRIFLIGDSTMANKAPSDAPETGWGMVFSEFFTTDVEIQNHAVNGRSTKSFRTLGHWDKVHNQLQKGDWVLIQFGHNDQKVSDTSRYAAPQTDYKQNLIRYIKETRAKGASPILLTPVMRRKFDENGNFVDQHGDYPAVVKAVAKELNVPLIDLHEASRKVIVNHGVEGSKQLFMHLEGKVYPKFPEKKIDDTHFSKYGASVMASLVADAIKTQNIPLASYLEKFSPEKYTYELPAVQEPAFRKDTFSIVTYGAKADGITLNTKAIADAIDACNKAGGGTVLIPQGLWVTGPVVLKSNINVHLAKGAILQFSSDFNQYPLVQTNWEGLPAVRCQQPISGTDLENIAITGTGIIDGAGDAWRPVKKSKLTAGQWQKLITSGGVLSDNKETWYPSEKAYKGSLTPKAGVLEPGKEKDVTSIKDFLRPNLLVLTNCKRVLLESITFQNSPAWCLHPLLCEHITLRNLYVKNPWYAQNGDGVDLESCRNGVIEDCTFDVGDDGICIKSGRDEEGRKRGVPTENISIRNSTVYHAHGGFVIGSEMSGGARNLFVSNCTFMGTDVGLRFKTTRGRGGIVEKIYVKDIQMTNIAGEAILFDMYYSAKDPVPQPGDKNELPVIESKPVNEGTPQFRDFYVHHVVCQGAETAIMVRGLPEMNVKDILIENAMIQSKKGLVCIEGSHIQLKDIVLLPEEKTVMQIQNSQQVVLDNIRYPENTDLLVKVTGDRSKNIRLLNTDGTKAKKEIELGEKVSSKVIQKK